MIQKANIEIWEFFHENFQNNVFWWKGATFLHEKVIVFKEFNLLDPYQENVSTEIKSTVLFTKVHTAELTVASVINTDRYNSLLKLFRITAWIFRFVKNLKNKVASQQLSRKPFITSAELRASGIIWLKENQKKFDKKRLKILTKDLNVIYDDDNLIWCKGRLKNAPLPYETKTPHLINMEHCLATLIVKHFHESLLHISIKQSLTELCQKYWICRFRNFVRKIWRNWNLCRKYEGPPYHYPGTPSLTKLILSDTFAFFLLRELIISDHCMQNQFSAQTPAVRLFIRLGWHYIYVHLVGELC